MKDENESLAQKTHVKLTWIQGICFLASTLNLFSTEPGIVQMLW